ncbi:hypothetical protein HU830_05505 [Lactobacillus sp. DCY120]|uniref:Uncharacterized protein n=1 Tax=Bombilactobacillus apium TaxID=2675299 RepID=A0A850R708_9LACO|nr:hypothetical protein [Bombilactobacillus apium]NVY96617.1 hypothetical protein [Bombilactobacillus apium]
MLVSYLTEKQKRIVLKLVWRYHMLNNFKYLLGIIDLLIIFWGGVDWSLFNNHHLYLWLVVGLLGIVALPLVLEQVYLHKALQGPQFKGCKNFILFLDNQLSIKQKYCQLVKEIPEILQIYRQEDLLAPGDENYQFEQDFVLRELSQKLSVLAPTRKYDAVIITTQYYLLIKDQSFPRRLKWRNIPELFIIKKTAENMKILATDKSFELDLKKHTSRYFDLN